MKRSVLVLVLVAAFSAVNAADVPQGSRFDNRIQYVNYNAGDVVVVRAVAGLGTRVVFAPGETILDVASGFTQGWEFSDRRNILYIKAKSLKGEQGQPPMTPESGKWDTNLMVTTNLRMYDIDLHLLPGNNSGKAPASRVSYRVEYKYPADELAAARALAEKDAAQARLDAKPAPRNWNYSMQIGEASDNIAPTMAYDDGRFTYLKFPNNRDFPAAFLVAADKSESLVNSHIDPDMPDTLVLQRVAKAMVLRLGTAVVGVYNDAFDPDGVPATEGTTIPGVKRVIKSGEKAQ
ncbi:P-type conjugative transfer protein VirB9 [Microvirgula aerodenitrificans]|uniref:P-type conjugative transfer protein VirB9 n=1 Tax=Microvirgula aerodenitrificans TaxID=57480 RepID=UPI00248E808A|nr:P-type conjugative transfer protein VirB9 [Microvirgula aerodenitrificans]